MIAHDDIQARCSSIVHGGRKRRVSGIRAQLKFDRDQKQSGLLEQIVDRRASIRGQPVSSSWSSVSNVDRWERGFAALSRFREREGHCHPSRYHVESKFDLGHWISAQRYRKDLLAIERERRLEAIGFVWDWRDYFWEQNFAALLNFKQREGHCCVPAAHCDGNLKLGNWVARQRRNRNEMSAGRQTRLNEIGFVWNAAEGRRAN